MLDAPLRQPLFNHYMFVRSVHVRMAVASIHFGERARGTELELGVAMPAEKAFPGIPSTQAMLAQMARQADNEALALQIESYLARG